VTAYVLEQKYINKRTYKMHVMKQIEHIDLDCQFVCLLLCACAYAHLCTCVKIFLIKSEVPSCPAILCPVHISSRCSCKP